MGTSLQGPFRHGTNARELKYAVKAGRTPLQAIEAATANGPLTLGPRAPKSGILQQDYDADMIAVCKNPLEDICILEDPLNISHVWKAGTLHKEDSRMFE